MEDFCEERCVFDDPLEIDFDYEFDVAKFFDLTRPETAEEIQEAEMWFQCSQGYPPSPLVIKLIWGTEEFDDSETSSSKYGHENTFSVKAYSDHCGASDVCSLDPGKRGLRTPKSKSKCPSLPILPRSSRLLKPTASHLAKQNQQISVRSTRIIGRLQKLGSPLKSPGEIVATKRQKLEIGYLRKVANLKHQTRFSHKLPKKVVTTDVNSSARPKVTVPKEPVLETAHRAQRHRSKNAAQPGNDSTSNSCATNASLQEKSDQVCRFRARPFNKKIFSSQGNIGVFRNSKQETTIPREFKLSSSKKFSQNPPIELFKKLSLNSQNQPSSFPEQKQPLSKKGLKKSLRGSLMKENKIPDALTDKSRRCCLKPNSFDVGRAIRDIANHPMSARSFLIH